MKIFKNALTSSVIAVTYVALIVTILLNSERLFGPVSNKILSGMAFLLTFVFSAAFMGIVIFAKPTIWCLDGHRKEAVKLTFATLGFMLAFLGVIFLLLLLYK